MPISSMTATAKASTPPARTPADSTYARRPARWRRIAAAIGERTEFMLQANKTAPGSSWPPAPATCLSFPVQRTNQREQAPRRIVVDGDLTFQPLQQHAAALVVQAPPAHVYGLDARRQRRADPPVASLADEETILHAPAPRRQRPHHREDAVLGLLTHRQHQTVLGDRQIERLGTPPPTIQLEEIALQDV